MLEVKINNEKFLLFMIQNMEIPVWCWEIIGGYKKVEALKLLLAMLKSWIQRLISCDALILGAPNHMANPSRTMKSLSKTIELD